MVNEDLRAGEVIKRIRTLLKRGDVTLDRELLPDLPAVSADRIQLQQVQLNLIMGLAICRSIITTHHVQLWAEANETGGGTFHVVLPIMQGPA